MLDYKNIYTRPHYSGNSGTQKIFRRFPSIAAVVAPDRASVPNIGRLGAGRNEPIAKKLY